MLHTKHYVAKVHDLI